MTLSALITSTSERPAHRNPQNRLFSFWTENDVAILRSMARRRATYRAIAKALYRSEGSIRQKAFQLNLVIPTQLDTRPEIDLEGLTKIRSFERGGFILARVSAAYGIGVDVIKSESRLKDIVQARHHAIHLIADLTNLSFPRMAAVVGRSDHTTMIHAIRVMNDRTGQNVRGLGGVDPERVIRANRYKAAKKARRFANAA